MPLLGLKNIRLRPGASAVREDDGIAEVGLVVIWTAGGFQSEGLFQRHPMGTDNPCGEESITLLTNPHLYLVRPLLRKWYNSGYWMHLKGSLLVRRNRL